MWPCSFISWVDHLLNQEQYHCLLQHFQNCFLPLRGSLAFFPLTIKIDAIHLVHAVAWPDSVCIYQQIPAISIQVRDLQLLQSFVQSSICSLATSFRCLQSESAPLKKNSIYQAIFSPSNQKCMFQDPLTDSSQNLRMLLQSGGRNPASDSSSDLTQFTQLSVAKQGPKLRSCKSFPHLFT